VDVYTNQYLVDPLIQQQVQGQQAASKIAEILRGPQMRQAQKMQDYKMAPLQGEGWATQAPTVFDAFAQMAQNYRGNQNAKAMQEQADVLRGDVSRGYEAELQAKDFNQQRAYAQNSQMAADARADNMAKVYGKPEAWVNKNGEQREFINTGYGPVDPVTKQPVNLEGFQPIQAERLNGAGSGLGRTQERESAGAFKIIRAAQGIKDIAGDFTDKDIDSLNTPAFSNAVKIATPAAWEAYVTNNWKTFSPAVKKYVTKLNMLGAKQIHELYASALTKLENQRAQGFAVGTEGLILRDALMRVDSLYDSAVDTLGGIQDATGKNLLDHDTVTSYKYGYKTDAQKQPSNDENLDLKAAAELIKKLEAELMQ